MDRFRLHSKPEDKINGTLVVNIQGKDSPEPIPLTYGYDRLLNDYRNEIDTINNDIWKKVRWYINEYDFLVKDPIINRAFYKYWEIINEFELYDEYKEHDVILHCAEAPGGFIQGSNIYLQIERQNEIATALNSSRKTVDEEGFTHINKRKKKSDGFKLFTISLNKDLAQYKAYNLPSYNKHIISKYLCITYGKDNTGDISNVENIDYIGSLSKKQFYLITADGGFDEGTDFNNKEQLHYALILSEIYTAIKLQKRDSHFVLKVFDIFTESSIHMLYLLRNCYKEVYIYKPKTSRPTNSEKYIICKYFDLEEHKRVTIVNQLRNAIMNIKNMNHKYIKFTLFKQIDDDFVDSMKDINSELVRQQCEHLAKAISLCNDSKFMKRYETNLQFNIEKRRQTFKEWEEMYNLNSYV